MKRHKSVGQKNHGHAGRSNKDMPGNNIQQARRPEGDALSDTTTGKNLGRNQET